MALLPHHSRQLPQRKIEAGLLEPENSRRPQAALLPDCALTLISGSRRL